MSKARKARSAAPEVHRKNEHAKSAAAAEPKGELPALTNMLASLKANEPGAALAHGVAAWRALPAPSIAELVATLDQRIAPALGSIAGTSKTEVQDAWIDLANKRRAIDLARLLPVLGDASLPHIRARFEALGAFAPDPRLAPAMLPLPGEYSYEAGPSFKIAFDITEASRDPRAAKLLDAVVKQLAAQTGSKAWNEYLAKQTKRATKIREALPAKIDVPAAVAKQITACEAALAKLRGVADEAALIAQSNIEIGAGDPRLAQLLAAVLEHPADDHARAVYADALSEVGDPRGEFIHLQLRGGPPSAREKELFTQYGRTWCAPLDAVIAPGFAFGRGFLEHATVTWKTDAQVDELAGHPLWATVRELDADQEFLLDPVLRDLRRANATVETLAALAKAKRPVPLEAARGPLITSYGIRGRFGIDLGVKAMWGTALDVGALVHLTSLSLSIGNGDRDLVPSKCAWLLDSKLGKQLTELEIHGRRGTFRIAPWVAWLVGRDGITVRGSFSNANTASGSRNPRVVIDLVRNGTQVDVTIGFNDELVDLRYLSLDTQLATALDGLPSPHVGKVAVEYIGSKKRTVPGYPAVAELLREAFPAIVLA